MTLAPLYPFFLRLEGRMCVVIGGDECLESKIRDLVDCKAKVRVIASSVTQAIAELATAGRLEWSRHDYQCGDLNDAMLVITGSDAGTNAQVFDEAERLHVFCNAVDDVPHCSCFASAVVRRGPLQIAISTNGQSPALAQRLRKELEQSIAPEYGPWVEHLGEQRCAVLDDGHLDSNSRKALLHEQASGSAFDTYRERSKR